MGKDEEKSRPLYNTLTHSSCISYQARSFTCSHTHRFPAIFPQWWIKSVQELVYGILRMYFLYTNIKLERHRYPAPSFNRLIKHWYRKILIFVKRILWRYLPSIFAIHLPAAEKTPRLLWYFQNFWCADKKKELRVSIVRGTSWKKRVSFIFCRKHKHNRRHLICNEWIRNYVR